MRHILSIVLGATIAAACSASDPEIKSVDTTAAALGASPMADTPAVTALDAPADTSRAALVAEARRNAPRPGVVYHGNADQQALSELRLQRSKTTYRRLEPVKRPATNR